MTNFVFQVIAIIVAFQVGWMSTEQSNNINTN
jgi:hypothetical protein